MASLESPPAGGDRNTGPALATTVIVFDIVAAISVVARLYVRSRVIKQLGMDDALIVISLITWIVAGAFIGFAIHKGLGRHVYYLSLTPESLADFTQVVKWQYLAEILTSSSLFFARISICLFLLRIFGPARYWRRILYCAMAFITLINVSSIMMVITQCRPLRKNWDPLGDGKCVSSTVLIFVGYYNGVVSVVGDCILSSLPILCMWKIQMRPRLKAGICVLMAMGFFSGICGIVRTAFTGALFGKDPSWDLFRVDLAVNLEQNLVILAACIPALRPLFRSKESAKKSTPQLEDQRPLHRQLDKSTPSPLLTRTADDSAGTHQAENEPNSLFHSDEIGLESVDGRGDTMEIGLPKTVHPASGL